MAEALVLAVGVAASPLPILAVILILSGVRARSKALAFAAAWAGGLAVATGFLVVAVEASGATDDDPAWIAAFELGVAAALVALALHVAVRGTRRTAAEPPRWLAALDRATPRRTAALGALLSCGNPKNVALVLGAAVAFAEAGLSGGELAAGSAAFVAVGSAGVAVPLGARAALPDRAPALLAAVRGFVERHDRAVTVVLGLGIALLFAASGVQHL
jgi:hypothetical protein